MPCRLTYGRGWWGKGDPHPQGPGSHSLYMEYPPAGRAGLGKLLSLTSSHGVKILRQTLGVNCQIMSSTSPSSLRFHCECLSRLPLFLKKPLVCCIFSFVFLLLQEGFALCKEFIEFQPNTVVKMSTSSPWEPLIKHSLGYVDTF